MQLTERSRLHYFYNNLINLFKGYHINGEIEKLARRKKKKSIHVVLLVFLTIMDCMQNWVDKSVVFVCPQRRGGVVCSHG